MRAILFAAIATAVAATALAQDASTPFTPQFERVENAHPGHPVYPGGAAGRGTPGAAVVCCVPRPNRMLSCRTAWEAPEGQHFGNATQRFMEQTMRLTEASAADYAARPDHPAFPLHMQFRMNELPAPTVPTLAERQTLCASGGAQ